MRFRNSSNQLIHRDCIYRQGDLPYGLKTININYQGHDTSLSGLCPCDYPLDIYCWRVGPPHYVEKWRSNEINVPTFLWSSEALASNYSVVGSPTYVLGVIGGHDALYLRAHDDNAGTELKCIDGDSGATVFTTTVGADITPFPPQVKFVAPRNGGGCFMFGDKASGEPAGKRLYKITGGGAVTRQTGVDISGFESYGRHSFANPDGVIIRKETDDKLRLHNDSLAVVGDIPLAVYFDAVIDAGNLDQTFVVSDQNGSIYGYGKCFSNLTVDAWALTPPEHALMAMVNDAGVSPEAFSEGDKPLIMTTHQFPKDITGVYNQENTKVWSWSGNASSWYFDIRNVHSYYHTGSSVQTDFVGTSGHLARFNHYGTLISRGFGVPGTTIMSAAGGEACLRSVA